MFTTAFSRGDIILVPFPYTDHTTVKQRPALVIQTDSACIRISTLIVAQITSNICGAGHPSRVVVRLGGALAAGMSLRTDSVITMDNVATIDPSLVGRAIGRMPDMALVDDALRRTFGV